jgi:hypothetical protein
MSQAASECRSIRNTPTDVVRTKGVSLVRCFSSVRNRIVGLKVATVESCACAIPGDTFWKFALFGLVLGIGYWTKTTLAVHTVKP